MAAGRFLDGWEVDGRQGEWLVGRAHDVWLLDVFHRLE